MAVTETTPTPNPYLSGNFAPVRDERDDAALELTGSIPPQLDGLLLRNGANPVVDPDPAEYHWFLGDGMLHGIELRGGAARYRNRWVRTASARAELGEPAVSAGPPEVNGIPTKANTHVVPFGGHIYALVESSLPTEVRPDLSTVGPVDFAGALSTPFTAHPKIDAHTGEMHFFGYDFVGPPYLRYHVVNAKGELARSEDITIPGPVMVHDFAITATNVVWLDLPVVFDLNLFATQPFPFTWRPEHGARVGVMPRTGGDADVVWTTIDPCYAYHPFNAYDAGDGSVVLDLVVYPDMFATEIHGPGASSSPKVERWTIDAARGSVGRDVLDDVSQEFPRIDERETGRVHRYGYATEAHVGEQWAGLGGLRKHDFVSGHVELHDVGDGRAAGEGVFVPAAADAGEDEGWVLSVVYDATRDASDLLIIDATDFTGAPVATVHLPQRVPFGFHGSWVHGASLG